MDKELYAEVVGRSFSWSVLRELLRDKVEEDFGACEILSLRIDFPYLEVEMVAKGVEVFERVRIERGWFESEEKLVNALLPFLGRRLGVSFTPVRREEVLKRRAQALSKSLFEEE